MSLNKSKELLKNAKGYILIAVDQNKEISISMEFKKLSEDEKNALIYLVDNFREHVPTKEEEDEDGTRTETDA